MAQKSQSVDVNQEISMDHESDCESCPDLEQTNTNDLEEFKINRQQAMERCLQEDLELQLIQYQVAGCRQKLNYWQGRLNDRLETAAAVRGAIKLKHGQTTIWKRAMVDILPKRGIYKVILWKPSVIPESRMHLNLQNKTLYQITQASNDPVPYSIDPQWSDNWFVTPFY